MSLSHDFVAPSTPKPHLIPLGESSGRNLKGKNKEVERPTSPDDEESKMVIIDHPQGNRWGKRRRNDGQEGHSGPSSKIRPQKKRRVTVGPGSSSDNP
jgi:hypothetical protein